MAQRTFIGLLLFACASGTLLYFVCFTDKQCPNLFVAESSSRTTSDCSENKHIFFLKVFKAGSTTIQNIFLRFGFTTNASVLVLKTKKFSYPTVKFTPMLPPQTAVIRAKGGKYDIYCEHSVFNEKMLHTVLPRDTVNIATVREPFSRLQSAFGYYNLPRYLPAKHRPTTVDRYIMQADFYASKHHYVRDMTQNTMARQFGYKGEGNLTKYLKYIESKFFVLLVERMAESLVLMRRTLCWNIKDILHFQMRKQSSSKVAIHNQTVIDLYKVFSPWDYAFYDHFKEVMEQKLRHQPPDFADEVILFQRYLIKTSGFCEKVCQDLSEALQADTNSRRDLMVPILENYTAFNATFYHKTFTIFGFECLMMKFDPEVYRKALRQRYFPNECTAGHSRGIVDKSYCQDYFRYNFPWHILEHSSATFKSACL